MAGFVKGGAAARVAWNLIDPDAIERVHISSVPDDVGVEVIRALMIISRSVIRDIAAAAHVAYSDLRVHLWQQLAAMPTDSAASESARVLLTAWDDPELADLVTADMLSNADPADIAVELALLLTILASMFTRMIGEPLQQYYFRIRAWLDV
jgi:hypothetical protein